MSQIALLAPKGMHYLLVVIDEWKQKFHVNQKNEIVFQNKGTYANVRLSDGAIHKISQHSRGFEALPETIANPDEIWSKWVDPKKQTEVLRSYIKYAQDGVYIVLTHDGSILDGFAATRSGMKRYQKGVPLKI